MLKQSFVRSLSTALLLLTVSTGAALAEKTKKALLIGIDGTRFDALETAHTPHLDALMDDGVYTDNCLILGPRYKKNDTISGPGWSSILSGVWADKHGVDDNTFEGKNYDEFPHFFVLLKQQQPDARTVSHVTWTPIEEHIVQGADVHADHSIDIEEGFIKSDTQATDETVKQIAETDVDCAFIYFHQTDFQGHTNGFHPSVKPYVQAIANVDVHIGRVIEAIRARDSYAEEDWLIVVTSDHGGIGKNHINGHNVPEILRSFLIVSGDSAGRGRFEEQTYIVDASATVLTHLGVELEERWRLDGRPRGLK